MTLGTHPRPFPRLISGLRAAIETGEITPSSLFVQHGSTPAELPTEVATTRFLSHEAYGERMDRASIVISHGGTGSIIRALQAGKTLVVAPRRARLGEHTDDHQTEIAGLMESRGWCSVWNPTETSLRAALEVAEGLPPRPDFGWPSLQPRLRTYLAKLR